MAALGFLIRNPESIRDPESIRKTASPAFYSEKTFMMDDPDWAVRWLERIGPENVRSLVKLRLFVSGVYNPGPHPDLFGGPAIGPKWCKLLEKLASEAIGLQDIYIYWDAEPTCYHFGGGSDMDFVRALARMNSVQKLEIDGFFAKEWPAYLKGQLSIEVWERQDQGVWYSEALRKFQRSIKDLSP